MRVLALVPNTLGHAPGQRSLIETWEPFLKQAGIHIDYKPFETDRLHKILYQPGHYLTKATEMFTIYVRRFGLLRNLDDYDAVFVYREAALIGPALLEKLIARRKPIIYNLDDPLYIPYRSNSNGYFSYLKFFSKINELMRMSKVFISNSSHILEHASQFNGNLWKIPNTIDTNVYVYKPFPKHLERVCVGWSGSPSTTQNMTMLAPALKKLSERVNFDLHLIGGTEFDLPDLKYSAQNWVAESEVEDLIKMQIGLIPLPDNEWNKRKFIMKTTQYMALGIVPVGTPIASNPEVIKHGVNGFLADTDDEWVKYLEILITDEKLRNKMSAQAAHDAEENFSLRVIIPKVIEAFRSAVK